jgi:hypothetical protein
VIEGKSFGKFQVVTVAVLKVVANVRCVILEVSLYRWQYRLSRFQLETLISASSFRPLILLVPKKDCELPFLAAEFPLFYAFDISLR